MKLSTAIALTFIMIIFFLWASAQATEYEYKKIINNYSTDYSVCAANSALAGLPQASHVSHHGHKTLNTAIGVCGGAQGLAVGFINQLNKEWTFNIKAAQAGSESVGTLGISYTW